MDYLTDLNEIIVQMARLGLAGKAQDVQAYLRRVTKRLPASHSGLASQLTELLGKASTAYTALRDASPVRAPVDADSRLSLVKWEYPVLLEAEPNLSGGPAMSLWQVIAEREKDRADQLASQQLLPARSLLFSGPPGVGKTLSARWMAAKLGFPLLTLDLATVMSSYLGKTGTNIRAVLDYAKSMECVLLLDEFDAIAKRRDDEGDVGELKRLVTVLLQEIDTWPASSLLVAATNHAELLDPAIWRRFDEVIEFSLPDREQRGLIIRQNLGDSYQELDPLVPMLEVLWEGRSASDISRALRWLRRRAVVADVTASEALLELVGREVQSATAAERKRAVALLSRLDLPQRKISALTGISRDTLRKHRSVGLNGTWLEEREGD